MLGFILSKLNLLIFVTAIFVIVTFFMMHLGPLVIQNQANNLISKMTEITSSRVNSETHCSANKIKVPAEFSYFGGSAVIGKRFFYKVRISKIEGESGKTIVIFKILERSSNELRAAGQIETSANVRIFKWEQTDFSSEDVKTSTDVTLDSGPDYYAEIDPQKTYFSPPDALYIIKENYEGDVTLYLFTCPLELCALKIEDTESNLMEQLRSDRGIADDEWMPPCFTGLE